jgi:putative lipase involved disintegration of autophagic bodies
MKIFQLKYIMKKECSMEDKEKRVNKFFSNIVLILGAIMAILFGIAILTHTGTFYEKVTVLCMGWSLLGISVGLLSITFKME